MARDEVNPISEPKISLALNPGYITMYGDGRRVPTPICYIKKTNNC